MDAQPERARTRAVAAAARNTIEELGPAAAATATASEPLPNVHSRAPHARTKRDAKASKKKPIQSSSGATDPPPATPTNAEPAVRRPPTSSLRKSIDSVAEYLLRHAKMAEQKLPTPLPIQHGAAAASTALATLPPVPEYDRSSSSDDSDDVRDRLDLHADLAASAGTALTQQRLTEAAQREFAQSAHEVAREHMLLCGVPKPPAKARPSRKPSQPSTALALPPPPDLERRRIQPQPNQLLLTAANDPLPLPQASLPAETSSQETSLDQPSHPISLAIALQARETCPPPLGRAKPGERRQITTSMRISLERSRASHKLVGILQPTSITALTGKRLDALATASPTTVGAVVADLAAYGARWSKSTLEAWASALQRIRRDAEEQGEYDAVDDDSYPPMFTNAFLDRVSATAIDKANAYLAAAAAAGKTLTEKQKRRDGTRADATVFRALRGLQDNWCVNTSARSPLVSKRKFGHPGRFAGSVAQINERMPDQRMLARHRLRCSELPDRYNNPTHTHFTREMRAAHEFFEALLPRLPRRTMSIAPDTEKPLLVYTDAMFRPRKRKLRHECESTSKVNFLTRLGIVLYDPADGATLYGSLVPSDETLATLVSLELELKTYIAQLEVLAAVAVYYTFPDRIRGRRVNHFVDNTVALSALIHGYVGKIDLARMVNAYHLQLAALRASVYLEYVPSLANIADLPSRNEFELLKSLGGRKCDVRLPPAGDWSAPLGVWFREEPHPEHCEA
jgi:hypothetical protein